MIHDRMIAPSVPSSTSTDRRRDRRHSRQREICLYWLSDPSTTIRLEIIDHGKGGFRVRTSLPMPTGTTGVVTRVLPKGDVLDRAVSVAWTREVEGGDWEMGIEVL